MKSGYRYSSHPGRCPPYDDVATHSTNATSSVCYQPWFVYIRWQWRHLLVAYSLWSVLSTPSCRSTSRERHYCSWCNCWSICGLFSESNNTNLLVCLHSAVLGTSILLHVPNTTSPTTWRRVLGDHRQNSVTSLHLIYTRIDQRNTRQKQTSKTSGCPHFRRNLGVGKRSEGSHWRRLCWLEL